MEKNQSKNDNQQAKKDTANFNNNFDNLSSKNMQLALDLSDIFSKYHKDSVEECNDCFTKGLKAIENLDKEPQGIINNQQLAMQKLIARNLSCFQEVQACFSKYIQK